jgi:hypothetical protein
MRPLAFGLAALLVLSQPACAGGAYDSGSHRGYSDSGERGVHRSLLGVDRGGETDSDREQRIGDEFEEAFDHLQDTGGSGWGQWEDQGQHNPPRDDGPPGYP